MQIIFTIFLFCIVMYLVVYILILRKQLKNLQLEQDNPLLGSAITERIKTDTGKYAVVKSDSTLANSSTEINTVFEKLSSYPNPSEIDKHYFGMELNKDVNLNAARSIEELDKFLFVALDNICVLDLNGKFERINRQWELLSGYPENQFPGTYLYDYLHENDIIATREFIESFQSNSGITTFINRFRTFDKKFKWLEWRLVRAGNQIYAAARDITERKRDEDTLRDLVQVTVKTPTEGFFESICEWVRKWLNADVCVICELYPSNVIRTVAVNTNETTIFTVNYEDYEPIFDLTVQHGFCHYEDNLDAILPESALVQDHHARGYAGFTLHDKNGSVKGLVCILSKSLLNLPSMSNEVFQLIAVRATAELEYLQSEARYRSILSTAMDGFALLDKNGVFVDVNDAYCRLIGYSKDDLLTRSITDIDMSDAENSMQIRLEELQIKIHNRFETRHCKADGNPVDLEISINLLPAGVIRYVLFLRDITERKKTETALRDVTERFTLATRAASMGIWDWDVEQDILVWNDQMFKLYGREKEDETSFEIWKNTLHPEDRERTIIEIEFALKGIKEFDTEFRIVLPDQTVKYVRAISTVYRDKNGKASRLIGTNWDITIEKETQRDFRNAIDEADRANRSKSEFIANMSHEIRTPLNAVIGFSELLETLSTDEKQRQYIMSIITAGRSLLRIISDILDMSKIESGMMKVQFTPLELQPVFDEIEAIFKPKIEEKGLKFEIVSDPSLPKVFHLDEIRLRQVLLNLVGNAVKFTDNGYIKINTYLIGRIHKEDSTVDISIQIEDTGIGIPADEQSIIFEPFRQRTGQNSAKYGGTGLGLSISKKLTELMNGELSVSSNPGKGSVFSLNLYKVKYVAMSESPQSKPMSSSNGIVYFTSATVLIADDVESNRVVIREHLVRSGLEVIEVDNGIDAARVASERKPQAIIMDIRMPKLNGTEAIKKIRESEETKNIPVIALSAASNIQEIEHSGEFMFSDYLCKPVERDQLIRTLTKYIPLQGKKHVRRIHREKISLSPEIKETFRSQFLGEFDSFNGAIRTQSLRKLIVKLIDFSKVNSSKEIDVLAGKLNKAVAAYDIEKINSTLKKLTELCS